MFRLLLVVLTWAALGFGGLARAAESDGRADVSAWGGGMSPEARHWQLIDGKMNPLGSPVPETAELARIYDDEPPVGDGLGCPDPLLLPDGTLLLLSKRYHCNYPDRRKLARRYEHPSTMEVHRSTDGGRTWEFVGPLDPDPKSYDMLGCLFRPDGAPPGFARALVERVVQGDRLQTTWTYYTEDSGRTWSERRLLFGPHPEQGGGLSHAFNGIKKLSDGTLLMPLQRIGPWYRVVGGGQGLLFLPPVVARCRPTSDPNTMGSLRGHWELLEVGHDLPPCEAATPAPVISEPDLVVRPDGSMLLIMRGSCGWMFQSESTDGGQTWSRLHRSTFGCTNSKHHLLPLRDGTVLMAHHDANNCEGVIKRSPLAVSVSRDGGFTWERTVSAAWKSFWHYGYPAGIELAGGDLLYFSRYGPLHDAEAIGVTRVSRRFLDTARISLNADGCRVDGGRLHLESPEATATAANRLALGYPIRTSVECTVDQLSGRFQLLSIVGEGSMELVALGIRRENNAVCLDVLDFDNHTCRVGWRPLDVRLPLGKPLRATLTVSDPLGYQLDVAGRQFHGLTAKPLEAYTARIGVNVVRRGDPFGKTTIRAVVDRWDLSGGTKPYRRSTAWEAARPLYRFHCTQFALDENGPFHGTVPRLGVDLSIPQGLWSGMDRRNPYLLEANMGDRRDGVLIVEKPFLGPTGTIAFYGRPLPAELPTLTLLDSPPLRFGFLKEGEHLRAYARSGETLVSSEPLPRDDAGLYAWRWLSRGGSLRMEFVYVAANGDLTPVGTGRLPPLPDVTRAKPVTQKDLETSAHGAQKLQHETLKGPVRWMNDAAGESPFRGRMTSLGAWPNALPNADLADLGRY